MKKKSHAKKILARLKKEYGDSGTALKHRNAFELLVATVLSAQCTDKTVNKVTPGLFKKYKRPKDFAKADLSELRKEIRPTGFYRNKSKSIKNLSVMLTEDYGQKVPNSMEELIKLPGVARKTANIVLYDAYGKNEGIAVDTHVKRLSQRLGLTDKKDPVKIERDLMGSLTNKEWGIFSHLLISHGRAVCGAAKPKCPECVLRDICPSAKVYYAKKDRKK
jgi:endonuclease-3